MAKKGKKAEARPEIWGPVKGLIAAAVDQFGPEVVPPGICTVKAHQKKKEKKRSSEPPVVSEVGE